MWTWTFCCCSSFMFLSLVAESWDLLDLNGNSSSYSCWTNSLKVKSCKVYQSTSSSQSEEGSVLVYCDCELRYSYTYQIFWLNLNLRQNFKVACCIFLYFFLWISSEVVQGMEVRERFTTRKFPLLILFHYSFALYMYVVCIFNFILFY